MLVERKRPESGAPGRMLPSALSNGAATVSVDCRQRNNRYASSGRRAAAPFVTPATRRGFGSRLLECSIAQGLEEEVSLCYEAQRVVCILDGELSAE